LIVLASASPRRSDLLARLGVNFVVQAGGADESRRDGELPLDLAQRLAARKAETCPLPSGASLVIAADTLVVLDGSVLGKPADPSEAREMLWRLRARKHQVVTGLALADLGAGCILVQATSTDVHMRRYTRAEVAAYVATGDPMDKAGAYAIQHPDFAPAAHIEQCYANVVGLPLCHVVRGLRQFGIETPRHPLQACPYAVEHGGCPWSEDILIEPPDRWRRCLPYNGSCGAHASA